ncbi:MAG: hypothetical protein ACE15D_10755 [Candidatus Eisenbacteria bacterium]
MIRGLFGASSTTGMLRGGLEETMATHEAIAERVASALTRSSRSDFASELNAQEDGGGGADRARNAEPLDEAELQRQMAALADTQLRYETDARLLTLAYQRLRAAVRQHG